MSDLPESFANYPKSLGEVRADKSQDSKDWTSRDALIEVLRDLDEGKIDPRTMVIVYSEHVEEHSCSRVTWSIAAPDAVMAMGTLTRAIFRMNAAIDSL